MSDLRQDIVSIIHAGVSATSTDNMQPWRFVVKGHEIHLYIKPEKNPEEIFYSCLSPAYISHGAMIENMVIAADHYGYEANVTLFPDSHDPLYVGIIVLRHDPIDRQVDLYRFIRERRTDRDNFIGCALTLTQKEAFQLVPETLGFKGRVVVIEKPYLSSLLSKLVSWQTMIILSYKKTHDDFYRKIHWSKQNVLVSKDGLDAKTFGVDVWEYFVLRYMFSQWYLMKVFAFFHITSLITTIRCFRFKNKESFIAIIVEDDSPVQYVESGRMIERVWLLGTKFGYGMQPVSGTFLLMKALKDNAVELPSSQVAELIDVTQDIRLLCGVQKTESLAFMFRIGFSKKVPPKSKRREPEIIFD
jgi:hypothetical protein